MFFNQFDVTVQFDVTADGGQSSVKMRLPSAKAEDLSLIQNFNDLWKRGTKEKGAGDVNVSMMLHRAWFEEEKLEAQAPVEEAAPAKVEPKAPAKRRSKKTAQKTAEPAAPEEIPVEPATSGTAEDEEQPDTAEDPDAENKNDPDPGGKEDTGEEKKPSEEISEESAQAKEEAPTTQSNEPVVAEADTEEQAAEKPHVSDAESARPDFAPELLEKWAELKQTDCSKEDVWNFARKTIPSAGDEAIVKGERILFSAVSSLVLLDPRIKNDSELTLTRVRDAVKHDLDTLGSFFAPNQISDLQHAALDAFELFKTLPDELQFASHAALVKWLGA